MRLFIHNGHVTGSQQLLSLRPVDATRLHT
jgi:hypothetical protein